MNTERTYTSAQKRYVKYCNIHGLDPFAANEQTLLWYIAYLYNDGVKNSRSISVYLSAVRALYVDRGMPAPPHRSPRIILALRGVDRSSPPPLQKMPITYDVLLRMSCLVPNQYQDQMMWSAMLVAFFGCLRADEITINLALPEPDKIVKVQDVKWYSSPEVNYLSLTLKRTKTLLHGIQVVIGCSGTKVCAYCSLKQYLQLRYALNVAPYNPALFVDKCGMVLSRQQFNAHTKHMVQIMGLDPGQYSGHSYRSGAATTAGGKNFKDWETKLLGHWKSDAYKLYIRQDDVHLASFAARLASNSK